MLKTNSIPVITIDGPSGSGKGTVSQLLAKKLKWHWLDSGSLYRAVANFCLEHAVDVKNEQKLINAVKDIEIYFVTKDHEMTVVVNGEPKVDQLRTEECGNVASQIAAIPKLRELLLEKQRDYRQLPGLVADGRDMGTVVFPEAQLKIFLTASAEERAKRRYKQLKDKGISVNLARLLQEINARDFRDQHRVVAPLKPAMDAVVIDSTSLSIEDVITTIVELVKKAGF